MNKTIGVDPSVSSTPSSTLIIDNVTASTPDIPQTTPPIPTNFPTVVQIVNGVVTPSLQVLLFNVLGIIDASVPNKDQNRAIKKLIRDGFDKAYMEVIREAYPDSNFAMGPGHALEPYENKYKAITGIVKPE